MADEPRHPSDRTGDPGPAGPNDAERAVAARLDAMFGAVPAPSGLADRSIEASLPHLRTAIADRDAVTARLDAWGESIREVAPADLERETAAVSWAARPAELAPEPAVIGRIGTSGSMRAWAGRLAMAASFAIVAVTGMWAALAPQLGGDAVMPDTIAEAVTPSDPVELDTMLVALDVGEDEFGPLAALDAELAALESGEDTLTIAALEGEILDLLPDVLITRPSG